MLKALRYDFYKIFKSKALLVVFAASVCLSVLDSFLVGPHYSSEFGFLRELFSPDVIPYLPLVFVVPFACKDFSSKFTKNVFPEYSVKDKLCYVLSKIVYIFAVNLIWYAVFFLSCYAFVSLRCQVLHVPFTFEGAYNDTIYLPAWQGVFHYFCIIINAFALEMVLLFLSFLLKKEYFVLLIFIIYYSLAPFLYELIDPSTGLLVNFCDRIEGFTVFGMQYELSSGLGGDDKIVMARYTQCILVSLGYSALFALLSGLLVVTKKNV